MEKLSKTRIWWLVYVQIGTRGTVTEAAGFNPEADVQKLRDAMKGAGECHHICTWKENLTGISFLAISILSWKVWKSVLLPVLPWQLTLALLTASSVLCCEISSCCWGKFLRAFVADQTKSDRCQCWFASRSNHNKNLLTTWVLAIQRIHGVECQCR